MNIAVVIGDNVGAELLRGILSWQFLQFVVALVSFFGFMLVSAIILSLADRKIMAYIQDRIGPIHTGGPWGLWQAVADVFKLALKEFGFSQGRWLVLAPTKFLDAGPYCKDGRERT